MLSFCSQPLQCALIDCYTCPYCRQVPGQARQAPVVVNDGDFISPSRCIGAAQSDNALGPAAAAWDREAAGSRRVVAAGPYPRLQPAGVVTNGLLCTDRMQFVPRDRRLLGSSEPVEHASRSENMRLPAVNQSVAGISSRHHSTGTRQPSTAAFLPSFQSHRLCFLVFVCASDQPTAHSSPYNNHQRDTPTESETVSLN